MGDACCGPAATADAAALEAEDHRVEWRTIAAGVAAASWLSGVAAEFADAEMLSTTAFVIVIASGGSTFAPAALLALRRGRLASVC